MSRKADTLVYCDVCLEAAYLINDIKSGSLIAQRPEWFNGNVDLFLWKRIGKDIDVCPKCAAIISRAEHLGLVRIWDEKATIPPEGS